MNGLIVLNTSCNEKEQVMKLLQLMLYPKKAINAALCLQKVQKRDWEKEEQWTHVNK